MHVMKKLSIDINVLGLKYLSIIHEHFEIPLCNILP